jgi:lysine 2,3-aminomutase
MKAIPLNIRAKSARPKRQPHRELLDGAWWHDVPAWREIDEATFLDHRWQNKQSANNAEQLSEIVAPMVDPAFLRDMEDGLRIAMMAIRLSPYMLSLVDWDNPVRRSRSAGSSSAGVGSDARPSRCARSTRWPSRMTPSSRGSCIGIPTKCCSSRSMCARSTADTARARTPSGARPKVNDEQGRTIGRTMDRWQLAFEYLAEHDEVEDVVVSGGDAYMLPAKKTEAARRAAFSTSRTSGAFASRPRVWP